MPSRRDFLKNSGVLAALSAAGVTALPAQQRKPNIVILLASGLPELSLDAASRTPNLTNLAAESLQFDRSYVSCPETGPSQAALITGRFPFACGVLHDGMLLPANQPAITTELKNTGYKIAIIGDWRVSAAQAPDPKLAPDLIRQNSSNPFFLLIAWPRADASTVDDSVGDVLRAIDDLQLKNKTIVAFTSDHGYGSGPLESAVRIPLMLRYPALKAGFQTGTLASHVDIAPTLLGLCGLDRPDLTQGVDLMRDQPQSVYCAGQLGTAQEWRMVVRGLDKLVVDADQNVTQLYNLGTDPTEMDNRARDPSLELKRDELKALLNDWMRRTGDGMDPSGLKRRAQAECRTTTQFPG